MLTALAVVTPVVGALAMILRPFRRVDATLVLLFATPLLLIALKFARRLPFPVRGGLSVAVMALSCLTFIARTGFSLGATAGLVASVVIAGMLFGRRIALTMLFGTALALASMGALIQIGWLTPDYSDTDPRLLVVWVRVGVSFALITGALAIAVDYVVRHIERKYVELGSAYDELAELTRKLETAKEEERRRVARELHDDLGQDLTVLKLGLKSGKPTPFSDPVRIVDSLIVKVRELSRALRPALLDEVGLAPALSAYLEEQSTISGVKMELETPGFDGRLPGELEIACFRLVQEAVTNALRHAGPKRLGVRIARANGTLSLRIDDDGRGFAGPEALARAALEGHVGIVGMRERARALGGTFRIQSEPGKGTNIDVELPLRDA
jgi:signal transduction histidine kinase